jgi:enoyl-[acyl-carrier protein] reductase II
MLAAMILGAEGVQIGSRFVTSNESSAHIQFKEAILSTNEGDTILSLKQLTPVRLLKNNFYKEVQQAELSCASTETLQNLLGKGRAKRGMFEGDLENGELEIGQVSAMIKAIHPAADIVAEIWNEFEFALQHPLK